MGRAAGQPGDACRQLALGLDSTARPRRRRALCLPDGAWAQRTRAECAADARRRARRALDQLRLGADGLRLGRRLGLRYSAPRCTRHRHRRQAHLRPWCLFVSAGSGLFVSELAARSLGGQAGASAWCLCIAASLLADAYSFFFSDSEGWRRRRVFAFKKAQRLPPKKKKKKKKNPPQKKKKKKKKKKS